MKGIPEEFRKRVPLFKPEWMSMIRKMREHPHAPRWNTKCGDRLTGEDTVFVGKFEESLHESRVSPAGDPKSDIIPWIRSKLNCTEWFQKKLEGIDIEKDFTRIPFMQREDLQRNLETIVPGDENLSRLIINPTSGTTGQPIPCPNHPRAIGCYDPMIQFMLNRFGINEQFDHNKMAAIQFCAQEKTITYNTVHSYLNGAGFAKINIFPGEWRSKESPALYTRDMEPVFYSGDPFAFRYAMNAGIDYRPRAVISTATALGEHLTEQLSNFYQCPVINFYSLNETGPIAYSCPEYPEKFHLLPHDILIEIIGSDGQPAASGKRGMIVFSGGRNPYLPLLRYITGDTAALDYGRCKCGDPMPALVELEARETVIFTTPEGKPVNSIDIARILRQYPILNYRFIQHKDYSCVVKINALYPLDYSVEKIIQGEIGYLFDDTVKIEICGDASSFGDKTVPFVNEAAPDKRQFKNESS